VGTGRSAIVRSEEGVALMVHAHAGVGVLSSNQGRSQCHMGSFLRAWLQGEAVTKHCIGHEKEEGEIVIMIMK
jgi:hypothetical protein